jgi:ferric-dicitrate binding protein FerR (iron transport regulator)
MQKEKHQQLQNIWEVASTPFTPDEIELEKAHRRVMAYAKPRKWSQSPVFIYWQRTASILLIPLILSITYWQVTDHKKAQNANENEKPVFLEVSTPYGTHTKMNLPDGSSVWLNAGSLLKYPAVFAPGKRTVQLSGEAYFEVVSDENNPFMVETRSLQVQATGTAFHIEAYPKDSLAFVTLASGKINVSIENIHPIAMYPNERMEYNRNKALYEIRPTDAYKWYAWKDGIMVFRDDPLDYVFKKIGQTFNVKIEVKNAAIGKHLYRATFEDESLDEILRLLSMTAPIRYKYFNKRKDENNSYLKQRIEVYRK